MRAPPPPRALVPALAAVAGVVAAHTLDYLVVFPGADQRAAELHGTGHAYWPVAVAAAVAAGAAAVILAAVRGTAVAGGWRPRRPTHGSPAPVPACAHRDFGLGPVLAWQVVAFAVMETGERAMVDLPPSVLLHSPVFWLGVLLQLPIAWVVTRALRAVEEVTVQVLTRGRRASVQPGGGVPVPHSVLLPVTAALRSPARPRAPPLVAGTC